ncbi:hypothetical protein CHU98_g3526 [Xylaria longipes]|nr:hypothetical protein CHU98_g3526 [Xylaria longipes]
MYPDWPRSNADLVPLPRCDALNRSRKRSSLYAHVFKVAIREQIYPLKLTRSTSAPCTPGSATSTFNGDIDFPRDPEVRSRFLGRDGRERPLRGIAKQFGYQPEEEGEQLRPALARKMLRDISALQQLGIIHIDPAARQLVDGEMSDFSTAVTVPHFITTPELNPRLTPAMRSAMELETFKLAIDDYLEFDEMVSDWNLEHASGRRRGRRRIDVCAFPGRRGRQLKYQLRKAAQDASTRSYYSVRSVVSSDAPCTVHGTDITTTFHKAVAFAALIVAAVVLKKQHARRSFLVMIYP